MRTAIIIFGISGDLSRRKLLPALYHLTSLGLLPPDTTLVGITRQKITPDQLIEQTKLCVLEKDGVCDAQAFRRFRSQLKTFTMDMTDLADYHRLADYLQEVEGGDGMNRLFYLSIPPQVFGPIIDNMGHAGLNKPSNSGGFCHLLVEKPFGYDWQSAADLIDTVDRYFHESQVFRIDHYLAKETAQNILAFRFNNPIFEALWNRAHIQAIRITATETIGIENRVLFYEQTGALRDIIQSHLMQLLCLVACERPRDMNSSAIHAAKLALLKDLQTIPADAIRQRARRGQYQGYTNAVDNPSSTTETLAAIELRIDNDRWRDVPVYLQTGKALDKKKTTITISFTHPDCPGQVNSLTFSLQPQEAVGIDLTVKRPGFDRQLQTAAMDFTYERSFSSQTQPDAYERVLMDALRGDQSLFTSAKEVMESWRVLQPVVEAWEQNAEDIISYEPGSNLETILNTHEKRP